MTFAKTKVSLYFLCEKRDISKYRLSQLSGNSQSSLGRIMAQENLPSLLTLEKNVQH